MAKEKIIVPGGVDEYIQNQPSEVQAKLTEIREIIESVYGGAIQTVSYFQIPGYSYPGFDYSGMFAWFSFKEPYETSSAWIATLADPDGNFFQLMTPWE